MTGETRPCSLEPVAQAPLTRAEDWALDQGMTSIQ